MEVREIKTKNLVMGAVLGTLFMLLIWAIMGTFSSSPQHGEQRLDSDIIFSINGKVYDNVSLSNFSFHVNKGDLVEITLPYSQVLDGNDTIIILLYLSAVEAYVGEEQIYSYGMDRIQKDLIIGSGYHFIQLPEDLHEKDVVIRIHVSENNAFTSIDEMSLIPSDKAYRYFAGKNMVALFIGIFLAVLGLILLVAGVLATCFDKSFARLPLIGAFSLIMGAWSFSGNKTFQLFVDTLETGTVLEYVLLYVAPIPLLWMIYTMRKHENGWKKWVLLGQLIGYSLFVIVCFILHGLNIVHLPQTLICFHGVGATVLVASVIFGVFMVRNKTRDEMLFQLAIFILCGAIGLDLIRFNVQKYILPNVTLLKSGILLVATLVFILSLVLSYIVHLYDMLLTRTEKDMLTQLAYHDSLTGLYNRAKATERFDEIAGNNDEYCVISLDLNGLKYVNDTFGHEAGDKMLKDFSRNLHESFRGVGKCYRMGGDEFLVIIRKRNFGGIEPSLQKLTRLQAEASKVAGFEFDASYGVAYSREVADGTVERVYATADDRMYKMKLMKHNSRAAREISANQGKNND